MKAMALLPHSLKSSAVKRLRLRLLAPTASSLRLRYTTDVSASSVPYSFHPAFTSSEWRQKFSGSFVILEDFVSAEEETSIMKEVEPHLKRQVYEKDHWDDVSRREKVLASCCHSY